MKIFKRVCLALLVCFWNANVFAAGYASGLRDHQHTRSGDGGVLPSLSVTNSFKAGDGSGATPAYSFTSQTNMGMLRNSANTLSFSPSGVERLFLGNGTLRLDGASSAALNLSVGGAIYGQLTEDNAQVFTLGATSGGQIKLTTDGGSTFPFTVSSTNQITQTTTTFSQGVTFSAFTQIRLSTTAVIALVNATNTRLSFWNADFDRNSEYSASSVTVNVAGKYFVDVCVPFAAGATATGVYELDLLKNGALVRSQTQLGGTTSEHDVCLITLENLAAGDKLGVQAVQNSGATVNANPLGDTTRMWWIVERRP